MADNGFSFFDECAVRWVHMSPLLEECTSFSYKIFICDSIANSQRTTTKLSKTGGIAKVSIKVEKVNTVRHLIPNEMVTLNLTLR